LDFKLPMTPEPGKDSSVIDGPTVSGDGSDNYLCGNCGAVMCKNITPGNITRFIRSTGKGGMSIKCKNCGYYAALTKFESQF
jgi:DNA-directed RNA polymerase subunit RPC12/RpoP